MLTIDVYRAGVLVKRLTYGGTGGIMSATHEWEINAASTLKVECSGDFCFSAEDTFSAYTIAPGMNDGESVLIGHYQVKAVEPKHDSGETTQLVTCVDIPSSHLMQQATPGSMFLEGVSIVTGIARIKEFTALDSGHSITFSAVSPPEIGDSVIKDIQADTMLDSFQNLVAAIGARWRTRPDMDGANVEYGMFGTEKSVMLRPVGGFGNVSPDEHASNLVRVWGVMAEMDTSHDTYNCAYAEGGSYGENNESRITLMGAVAPAGFTLTTLRDTAGHDHARLCKDLDSNGQPFAYKRSILLSAGRLAATRNVEGDLTSEIVQAARNELMRRTAQLLSELATVSARYAPEVGGVMFGLCMPGDKIKLMTCRVGDCPPELRDVYVAKMQTKFANDGDVKTVLELGSRLETLENPLESYFETTAQPGTPPWVLHASYLVEGIATSLLFTYTFPTTYRVPPVVSLLPAGGCSWSIVDLTESSVTISLTSLTPPCNTIRFYVTPPV